MRMSNRRRPASGRGRAETLEENPMTAFAASERAYGTPELAIPGYVAGTWTIDPVHSDVSFTVRHMVVSKVRGHFDTFSGELVTAADPLDSRVTAEIDLTSINTGNEQRDAHIRSADFFEVETYPTLTYRSTGVRRDGDDFVVDGELTLKGVTRPVPLRLELGGFGPDAYGGTRAGFSATAEINRRDFNVNFNAALETGGAVVSDKVTIHLEIEAVLNA
jgi:polyisoprenoid-binding protein YceI